MNIAICEEKMAERESIRSALQSFFWKRGEDISISEYSDGEALLADFEEGYKNDDLIFQDISLPGISGVETVQKLRDNGCKSNIVFLSTSPDFAVEGYDLEISGYLLKPLNVEKLNKLLNRILVPVSRKRIGLNSRGHYVYLFVDEIMWVESRNNDVYIHMQDNSIVTHRAKLTEIEELIDDRSFLRCHQSYLVNMNHVRQVDECFHMSDGNSIPIRVRTRRQIADSYHHWFLAALKV
jgi:DNA-binding LytR/AlgR family response regulator